MFSEGAGKSWNQKPSNSPAKFEIFRRFSDRILGGFSRHLNGKFSENKRKTRQF
jgi:hypothetical protein